MIKRSTMMSIYGWLLFMPAAIFLISFTYYPTLATLAKSFYSQGTALHPAVFVGLENFELMLEDEVFWKVARNNVIYAVFTIPISIALAIIMALWVNKKLFLNSFVRMAYFTPTILPMIAVANIWLFFYTPENWSY
jgi:sn-glycerol 3-phosphate transport system permease protein